MSAKVIRGGKPEMASCGHPGPKPTKPCWTCGLRDVLSAAGRRVPGPRAPEAPAPFRLLEAQRADYEAVDGYAK